MLSKITALFKELLDGNDLGKQTEQSPDVAIACLLMEVTRADYAVTEQELAVQRSLLTKLTGMEGQEVEQLVHRSQTLVKESASLYDFTSQLRTLSAEKRFELIKSMWEVAHADGEIDPYEDAVVRKAAELLYVDHSQFIRAKLMVVGN
jgi:uncharacterized tellurite resistance protein B-like protein